MIGRVTDQASFQAFRRPDRRAARDGIWVSYLADGAIPPRVAFAVGRPFGSAVRRNLFRRRSREIIRRLPLVPGSYLIGARPSADRLSFDQLTMVYERTFSTFVGRSE